MPIGLSPTARASIPADKNRVVFLAIVVPPRSLDAFSRRVTLAIAVERRYSIECELIASRAEPSSRGPSADHTAGPPSTAGARGDDLGALNRTDTPRNTFDLRLVPPF